MYTVVDLFSGAGGLSLGFQQTKKYDIKVAFESNPIMQETYRKNHPGVEVCGDVCGADYPSIERKYGAIDVVIGGPPCQGFSNANRQKNHAISQNNSLVKQYIRAIQELKPKAFVMENVSMLRSDVHRFYLCKNDLAFVNSGKIETDSSNLELLEEEYFFDDALKIVQDPSLIQQYMWPDFDYLELNVIFKATQNPKKLLEALKKHEKRLRKIIDAHRHKDTNDSILNADTIAFSAIQNYYDAKIDASQLQKLIAPAVMYVLQVALAKDRASREGITIAAAKRETKAFIQIIHKFRDEALTTSEPPVEKVAIFDEAQRAWDESSLTNFMKRKKGVDDFNQSEPDFLIGIMDRHNDWATIICLVGGGQEIFTGEAGIEDWFRALNGKYHDWNIYLSDKMTDAEYVGKSSIDDLLSGREYFVEPSLHLGVSLRSFRSEKLATFVKALLDNEAEYATSLYRTLKDNYPIVLTRDFEKAKAWVKNKARGNERYGLLASSEGKRLRGIGIWVPSEINHVGWFLNGKDNVDSSFYLEVAASEFKVQGLEIDYGILAWDADLRYVSGNYEFYRYRGTSWNHINIEQRQKYLKNAYRVLLTRSRQGLVIFVPAGDAQDFSRVPEYYDGIYNYLKSIGTEEI